MQNISYALSAPHPAGLVKSQKAPWLAAISWFKKEREKMRPGSPAASKYLQHPTSIPQFDQVSGCHHPSPSFPIKCQKKFLFQRVPRPLPYGSGMKGIPESTKSGNILWVLFPIILIKSNLFRFHIKALDPLPTLDIFL